MIIKNLKKNKTHLILIILLFFNLNAGNKFTTSIKDIFDTDSKIIVRKIINNTDQPIKIINSKNETLILNAHQHEYEYWLKLSVPITNQEESIDLAEHDLKLEFINGRWVCFLKFFDVYGINNTSLFLRKISQDQANTRINETHPVCSNCKYDHIFTLKIFIENNEPILDVNYSCLDDKIKKILEQHELQKNK